MPSRKRQKGTTLIEVSIAALILIAGAVPLLMLIGRSLQNQTRSASTNVGLVAAQNILEEIRSKKWDENSTDPETYLDESSRTDINLLGPDTGESHSNNECVNCDDMDDYHGLTDNSHPEFGISVIVKYAVVSERAEAVWTTLQKTDFKMVEVTVTWTDNSNRIEREYLIRANGI